MAFTLYQNGVAPKITNKPRNKKPEDTKEAHKKAQREYYKRRGCFINYKKRICKRFDIPTTELKHIDSVEALDEWSRMFIKETSGVDVAENPIPYLIYVMPKNQGS